MKDDEKRIAIGAVIIVLLIALFFSFAPTLEERTEKIKTYADNYQEENDEEEVKEESPFQGKFLSW